MRLAYEKNVRKKLGVLVIVASFDRLFVGSVLRQTGPVVDGDSFFLLVSDCLDRSHNRDDGDFLRIVASEGAISQNIHNFANRKECWS